jgi:hypothetical protein
MSMIHSIQSKTKKATAMFGKLPRNAVEIRTAEEQSSLTRKTLAFILLDLTILGLLISYFIYDEGCSQCNNTGRGGAFYMTILIFFSFVVDFRTLWLIRFNYIN